MNLENVGKLVAEHSPSPTPREIKLAKAQAEQVAVQRMNSWITWGLLIVGIGVLLLVTKKTYRTHNRVTCKE